MMIFQPTVSGFDGEKKAVFAKRKMEMNVEAAAYMMASVIF